MLRGGPELAASNWYPWWTTQSAPLFPQLPPLLPPITFHWVSHVKVRSTHSATTPTPGWEFGAPQGDDLDTPSGWAAPANAAFWNSTVVLRACLFLRTQHWWTVRKSQVPFRPWHLQLNVFQPADAAKDLRLRCKYHLLVKEVALASHVSWFCFSPDPERSLGRLTKNNTLQYFGAASSLSNSGAFFSSTADSCCPFGQQ